jgi:hypothetical protein
MIPINVISSPDDILISFGFVNLYFNGMIAFSIEFWKKNREKLRLSL